LIHPWVARASSRSIGATHLYRLSSDGFFRTSFQRSASSALRYPQAVAIKLRLRMFFASEHLKILLSYRRNDIAETIEEFKLEALNM
jgi:hypothetical protein